MRAFDISGASIALSTNGFAAGVTGAAFALSVTSMSDSLGHKVTVKNNTATDHSAKTIAIVGTDANGNNQSETIAGPGNGATVTSTKFFKTLTSVTPSATIGADTFDIGWAAASASAWVALDASSDLFAVGFGCSVDAGSPTYSVQHCYDMTEAKAFTHSVVTAQVAAKDGSYTTPIRGIRLIWTAAGTVSLRGIQAGKV